MSKTYNRTVMRYANAFLSRLQRCAVSGPDTWASQTQPRLKSSQRFAPQFQPVTVATTT
jgi:hypothetical protein